MAKRGQIVGRLSIVILMIVVLLTGSIITGCKYLWERPSEWRYREGGELYEQGRLDEAIDKYTEAIRVEPGWWAPYHQRGIHSQAKQRKMRLPTT